MQADHSTIKESTLRELIDVKSINSACVIGTIGGYAIVFRCGEMERKLASVRGDVRLFTLDNASNFLSSIGLARFEVDASEYQRGRMRKARPDRSKAMKGLVTKPTQQILL